MNLLWWNQAILNKKIEARQDIPTSEELIKIFYNYPVNEPQLNILVTTEQLGNSNYRITLIAERLPDDSQEAVKIVMLASQIGKFRKVNEIKRNWKCYKNRGHQNWGIKPCE